MTIKRVPHNLTCGERIDGLVNDIAEWVWAFLAASGILLMIFGPYFK